MRVKTIKVGIKSTSEMLKDAKDYMKKSAKGQAAASKKGVYFENISAMRKALTEKRLEILRAIKRGNPVSIYALAKSLNRNVKSVSTDLKYLEAVGLVNLKKSSAGRERTEPTVNYDSIKLEIAM